MSDLRDHLFATLEALRDEDKPMDVGQAKAISDVAGRIIDSAKVEIDYMRAARALYGENGHGAAESPSTFFDTAPVAPDRQIASGKNGHKPLLGAKSLLVGGSLNEH